MPMCDREQGVGVCADIHGCGVQRKDGRPSGTPGDVEGREGGANGCGDDIQTGSVKPFAEGHADDNRGLSAATESRHRIVEGNFGHDNPVGPRDDRDTGIVQPVRPGNHRNAYNDGTESESEDGRIHGRRTAHRLQG